MDAIGARRSGSRIREYVGFFFGKPGIEGFALASPARRESHQRDGRHIGHNVGPPPGMTISPVTSKPNRW